MYGSTALLGYAMPLDFTPYAAPLHPKWSQHYYNMLGPDIPVHLDAYRQNHNKYANLEKLASARPELIVCAQGWKIGRRSASADCPPTKCRKSREGGSLIC